MQKDDKSLLPPEKAEQEKTDPQHAETTANNRKLKINQNAIHEIIQLDIKAWFKVSSQ
ncbi:hypothetical protein [Ponticaulis sp.]|uniref:hypothetical protein n=1 Tax=Ponticaulis sp. TaxID=2020902 RepID=UPI0025F29E17|nr:hypothetical protein [Ponticaulis sp.]|tara:strand:+ start:345 stop:518 length:174 start_codon:yes stop_codon:yes gene_type:complete